MSRTPLRRQLSFEVSDAALERPDALLDALLGWRRSAPAASHRR